MLLTKAEVCGRVRMVRQNGMVLVCGCILALAIFSILTYAGHTSAIKDWIACSQKAISVDRPLLLPGDDVLKATDENGLWAIYWRYINSVQVLCHEQSRFGAARDGGKEVCLDKAFIPGKSCLVYSFGSNFQFDFETAIYEAFECEIHTFDPTVDRAKMANQKPDMIQFHYIGLSGKDTTSPKGWTVRTLQTVMNGLNHVKRTIDILKIDIEGSEWSALRDMLQTNAIKRVKQICIELHMGNYWGAPFWRQLQTLRQLHEAGFKIFQHERNWGHRRVVPEVGKLTSLIEISLLNMNLVK